MRRQSSAWLLAGLGAALAIAAAVARAEAARELTVVGCLLSTGYAGFLIEDAAIEAIDGKPPDARSKAAAPPKWLLDGGGNLRRNVGEKVQVVGRSEWQADAKDAEPGTPHLEVMTVKTVAASCK